MTLTEQVHAGAFIVAELPHLMSRMEVTIGVSGKLPAGQVLGRTGATDAAVTVNPAVKQADFVGEGTLDLNATPAEAAVKEGTYRMVCKTKNAGGGVFEVYDPTGTKIADATEGVDYTTQLHFQINASGTDFEVGDEFRVEVYIADTAQTGTYVPLNVDAAQTGAEIAQAVLMYPVDTTSATVQATVFVKDAQFRQDDLTFDPAGQTAAQLATAIAQLSDRGMTMR